MYLLNQRFRQHQQIIWTGGGVQDRTIYEDTVFAKMLRYINSIIITLILLSDAGKMDDRDYHTCQGFFVVDLIVVVMLICLQTCPHS